MESRVSALLQWSASVVYWFYRLKRGHSQLKTRRFFSHSLVSYNISFVNQEGKGKELKTDAIASVFCSIRLLALMRYEKSGRPTSLLNLSSVGLGQRQLYEHF